MRRGASPKRAGGKLRFFRSPSRDSS